MKRFLHYLLAAVMFAACAEDAIDEQSSIQPIVDNAPETLTVGFEGGDETRIQLNEQTKTVWTEGDLVSVFYLSDANQKWQYTGETGARVADLTRVDEGTATTTTTRVVVVYPYNENYYFNTETYNVRATLPATQTYLKDSYGLDGNIMISSGEYNQFSLKNVCGWLKLQLTGDGEKVRSITLRGNNGEQVAGELYINSADATSTLASASGDVTEDDGENATGGTGGSLIFEDTILTEVTLDCSDGVTLGSEATSFYIALPPQTFSNGLTVSIRDTNGYLMTKSTENEVVIARNIIQPMKAFTFDGIIPTNELYYTATHKLNPRSGDWSANIVSHVWNETTGEGVISFDGEVKTIGHSAFFSSGITSITIPKNITSIGDLAFCYSCLERIIFAENSVLEDIGEGTFSFSDLKSISLPSSLKNMGDCVFGGCAELESIHGGGNYITAYCQGTTLLYRWGEYIDSYLVAYPAGNTTEIVNSIALGFPVEISWGAVTYCKYLKEFDVDVLEKICQHNFIYCDNLQYVDLSEVTTIENNVLTDCKCLESIYLPKCSTIGQYSFCNNESLTEIEMLCDELKILDNIGNNCTSLKTIWIPSGVLTINQSFNSNSEITSVYCKATVPPTLTDSFDSMVAPTIYVPAESVYLYKTAEGWKEFADYIVGYDFETGVVVEELQKPITYDWYTEVAGGYYEIDSPEELVALAKLCNGDTEALSTVGLNEAPTFEGQTIDITADINLINYCNFEVGSWEPIGSFSGTFNGNNHTISNLYYNKTDVASEDVGLFANVSNAVIRDITVDGEIHISGDTFDIGGIAAHSYNTLFENCKSSVDITSDNEGMGCCIGGICGSDSSNYNSFSTFIACQSDAYIKNTQDEWEWYNYLGGILGSGNHAKIIACVKQGGCVYEERTQSYTPVGGICGYALYSNDFRIIACYSDTETNGRMPGHILGACSYRGYDSPNSGTKKIKDCYYAGTSKVYNGNKGVGSDNYGGSTYSRDDGTSRSSDITAEIEIMNAAIEGWNTSASNTCYYRYTLDSNNNLVLVHQDYL